MTVNLEICDCSDGDILAADVYNHEGVKLVARDTMMNGFIIDRLKDLSIGFVQVYDPPQCADHIEYKKKKFTKTYRDNVVAVREMIKGLASGKKLDVKKVTESTQMIYTHLQDDCNDMILKYLSGIRTNDEYTYLHSVNVAFYCMLIAKWLRLSDDEIKKAITAGFLHDVGKAKIPTKILNKKTTLTDDEFAEIKKHPIYGYYILEDSSGIDMDIKRAVLLHHERVNQSGYPFSISADKIGILTRIVSVADVYDAMTSDRVYKKKTTPFKAFEMFMTSGTEVFDHSVTREFINHMSANLVGSEVMLRNGKQGRIVYIPPDNIVEPVVCYDGDYYSVTDDEMNIEEML